MKKDTNIFTHIKDYGILYSLVVVPVVLLVLLSVYKPETIPSTTKQVHWHAPIAYDLCGNTKQLSDSGKHGELHGHNDGKIHIEGFVNTNNRKETLGMYFDGANIDFSENNIENYINGVPCEGSTTPGKLSLFVNGKENFEFRNYIINNNDEIKITFK